MVELQVTLTSIVNFRVVQIMKKNGAGTAEVLVPCPKNLNETAFSNTIFIYNGPNSAVTIFRIHLQYYHVDKFYWNPSLFRQTPELSGGAPNLRTFSGRGVEIYRLIYCNGNIAKNLV